MLQNPAAATVLEHLPAGVVVLDAQGRVAARNAAAQRLLGPVDGRGERCCDLVGCHRAGSALEAGCIAEMARARGEAVGEVLVQGAAGEVWVTAAPVGAEGEVVLHLRTGAETGGDADDSLRIRTLGPMRIEQGGAVLDGDWLTHRPGQVLKYLVATRGRPVGADELLTVFWPQGGAASTNVRQAVHA